MTDRARWAVITGLLFVAFIGVIGLVVTDAPFIHWLIRLYNDKVFLKETVHSWGYMAPLVFIAIQALQVIISLIPGFPKDIISYLFGISPMPFWLFAVVSTIGRLPGTVISSYFGAHVAEHQYIYAIAFLAIVIAGCLPLYYYRDHLLKRLHKPKARGSKA